MFSNVSWFEQLQQLVIRCALMSSQLEGMNVWDEVLTFLTRQQQSNHLSEKVKLRFSAHFAMTLMLQNRVSDNDKSIKAYNQVVERYIKEIYVSKQENKVKMIPLYVSFLVGKDV